MNLPLAKIRRLPARSRKELQRLFEILVEPETVPVRSTRDVIPLEYPVTGSPKLRLAPVSGQIVGSLDGEALAQAAARCLGHYSLDDELEISLWNAAISRYERYVYDRPSLHGVHLGKVKRIQADGLREPGTEIPLVNLVVVPGCELPPSLRKIPALIAVGIAGRQRLQLWYDAQCFSPLFAAAFAGRIVAHLRARRRPFRFPAVSREVLSWEKSGRTTLREKSIWRRLETTGRLFGAKVAISDGRHSLTFAELYQRVGQFARGIEALNLQAGDRAVLYSSRSIDAIALILALIAQRITYVPCDPRQPATVVFSIASDAGAKVVLVDGSNAEMGAQLTTTTPVFTFAALLKEPPIASHLPVATASDPGREHLLYILYTSGTTGKPKGVCMPESAVAVFVWEISRHYDIGPQDRLLHFASLAFDVSVFEIFCSLVNGCTLRILAEEEKRDIARTERVLFEEGITVAEIPPAYARHLNLRRCAQLRIVSLGGESFSRDLVESLLLENRRVINGYGPTEAAVAVTVSDVHSLDYVRPPIGRALPGTAVLVLDSERRRVTIGEIGELYLAGDQLARGYTDQAETIARFRAIRLGSGREIQTYQTGDLVRWRGDGRLEFFGRADGQLKVNGYRVEREHVEHVLRSLDLVSDCHVFAEKHSGLSRLAAYLVPGPKYAETSFADLKVLLARQLPTYMVPEAFYLVAGITLTRNGKIPENVQTETVPDLSPTSVTSTQRDSLLEKLAGRISELISRRVSIDDQLCELGLDSLGTVQLLVSISELFSVQLELGTYLNCRSVRDLGTVVTGALDSNFSHVSQQKALWRALRMPWIQLVRDARVDSRRTPVLYFYGAGGTLLEGHKMAELLDADRRVYCACLPGRDHDLEGPAVGSLWRLSELIADSLEGLAEERIALVGYSMGGLLAYAVAGRLQGKVPRVARLITVCSRAPSRRWRNLLPGEMPNADASLAPQLGPDTWRRDVMASLSFRARANRRELISVPIDVCYGNQDPYAQLFEVEPWRGVTRGTCMLIELNSAHLPQVEGPVQLREVLAECLSRADALETLGSRAPSASLHVLGDRRETVADRSESGTLFAADRDFRKGLRC